MVPMGKNQAGRLCFVEFARWQHQGHRSPSAFCVKPDGIHKSALLLEEKWATSTVNMHRKFREVCTCDVWDM